ncbi:MAG: hypothetical protein RR603_04800, partial [Kurthia sp.]
GVFQLQEKLQLVESGIRQGSSSSTQIREGLEAVKSGAIKLQSAHDKLLAGYREGETAIATIATNFSMMTATAKEVNKQVQRMSPTAFKVLEMKHVTLAKDPAYIELKEAILAAREDLPMMMANVDKVNEHLGQLQAALSKANALYSSAIEQQKQLHWLMVNNKL